MAEIFKGRRRHGGKDDWEASENSGHPDKGGCNNHGQFQASKNYGGYFVNSSVGLTLRAGRQMEKRKQEKICFPTL